ncbi:hypothetical protein, partial [Photorhabdus laumondii]|uniref:hypothetical protein n=1 Tax=Photorhabdus laumondii TaxID=2218628 RepID=UPI001F44A15F
PLPSRCILKSIGYRKTFQQSAKKRFIFATLLGSGIESAFNDAFIRPPLFLLYGGYSNVG